MIKKLFTLFIIGLVAVTASHADNRKDGTLAVRNLKAELSGNDCVVSMQVVLDSLHLTANHQIFLTPYLEQPDNEKSVQMPTIVFSGRNMHYVYLRSGKTMANEKAKYNVSQEIWHQGGAATISYLQSVPMEPWMFDDNTMLTVALDTCGCGRPEGSYRGNQKPLALNPVSKMLVMPYPKLDFEDDKITKHEGKAKVQFEVDKFQLHDQVYTYTHSVTKRRHVIDNRQQLKVIDDSLQYALSSPNVELVGLEICGYASPESPYEHNEYLALNRSRAVVNYIEKRYSLPSGICTYRAVPENWAGFRQQTLAAKDITEQQRRDLLELIDSKVYSASDYDRKETELKTSPKFAQLYATKIHPDWFPELRYTQFVIATHLKPMTVEQLREIIKTEPQRMSLSQFCKVAVSYGHDAPEFGQTLETALRYFPTNEKALINMASYCIEKKDYDRALTYLEKAGDSDEANNLRGIALTWKKDFAGAKEIFMKAKNSVEASNNLQYLESIK